jgi:hypothetical protein
MIRTNVVTLSVIDAVAYRRKLPSGGSGIVIIREGAEQPGIATISKTSVEAIPAANSPKKLYPQEAFQEAMTLTAGLPYKKQGSVQMKSGTKAVPIAEEVVSPEEAAEEVIVESAEYQKIVDKYTDKNGKLSYSLLNKDLIRFIHSSSIARKMIKAGKDVESIRLYASATKYRTVTGNKALTEAQVLKITELLDEVSPKGVFRELNDEIRKNLKQK